MGPRSIGLGLALVATLAIAPASPAQEPTYTFSPDRWDMVFDFVEVGTASAPQTVTIANTGQGAMTLGPTTMTGPHAGDFALVSDSCADRSIDPGATCQVGVVFRPRVRGTRVAALKFANATGCASWIHLAGSGTTTAAPPRARAAQICRTTVTRIRTVPASRIVLPKTCTSRRKFRIKLNLPKGQRFKKITVQLRGRRLRVYRGKRAITTVIDLRGLPAGRFTLRVRAVTTKGKTYTRSRYYATCGKRAK